MYFTKPPVEYGATTHDLELAFSQTPENRGKITEYTAAFPSEINASHYVPAESDIIRLPVELGNEKISYNKDIVLLLGDTGVGKSTLLYYITGAELDVKNANISGERTSILKSNGHFSRSKIIHDTPAKTKFPNFYEHEGIIYLDCPGLGDTKAGRTQSRAGRGGRGRAFAPSRPALPRRAAATHRTRRGGAGRS